MTFTLTATSCSTSRLNLSGGASVSTLSHSNGCVRSVCLRQTNMPPTKQPILFKNLLYLPLPRPVYSIFAVGHQLHHVNPEPTVHWLVWRCNDPYTSYSHYRFVVAFIAARPVLTRSAITPSSMSTVHGISYGCDCCIHHLPYWARTLLEWDASWYLRDVQLHVGLPGRAQHPDAPIPHAWCSVSAATWAVSGSYHSA
jgi:hypothetical protein